MKKVTFLFLLLFFCIQSHGQSYWQGMGLTFNSDPMCMYYDSVTEKSFLAGNFQIVNGDSSNIMVYDGNNFTAMPKTPIQSVRSIIRYKSKIFVAGFGGLASWDGNTWTWIDSVSTFFNMKAHDNKLYVLGWQNNNRMNLPPTAVIIWNDTVWTSLLGIDSVFGNWGGLVTDIEFYKGKVYVGGNWFNPSRPELHDLMMHDGLSWKPVGYFGGDGMGGVNKFLVWRDTLYVAGMFLESPIIPGNSIAAWDGTHWHRLQQGVRSYSTGGGAINAMTIYNNELWVGGMFYIINGRFVATNYGNVAKWDGSQWCTMGSRSTGAINNFGRWKEELFAVGNIFVNNDMSKYRFIKWTGGNYTDTCNQNFSTGIVGNNADNELIKIYPMPANNRINIECKHAFSTAIITINDWSGRKIKEISTKNKIPEISVQDLPAAMYFLNLELDNTLKYRSKFVVSP